jgi:hypothetical protein
MEYGHFFLGIAQFLEELAGGFQAQFYFEKLVLIEPVTGFLIGHGVVVG